MHTLVIHPKPPFDFRKMVRRLQGIHHELFRFEGNALCRTVRLDGHIFLLRVTASGSPKAPQLDCEVYGNPDCSMLIKLHDVVSSMFSTELDLLPFYTHMEHDPDFSGLIDKLYGLRMVLEPDLFECMIKTIIGQQLNLSFASTLNKRLIEYTSGLFYANGQSYPVFPGPERIADLTVDALREMQFSRRKAEYVIDFARMVAGGAIHFEDFKQMEDAKVIETLSGLRGVGRWTAECFMLFGMGRQDLLPAADVGLRNAIRKLYGLGEQPSPAQVREIGQTWAPWSSYAAFYLWESLNPS